MNKRVWFTWGRGIRVATLRAAQREQSIPGPQRSCTRLQPPTSSSSLRWLVLFLSLLWRGAIFSGHSLLEKRARRAPPPSGASLAVLSPLRQVSRSNTEQKATESARNPPQREKGVGQASLPSLRRLRSTGERLLGPSLDSLTSVHDPSVTEWTPCAGL